MDLLGLSAAVVHEVKNRLAELELRLEARGDAQVELAIVVGCAGRLTGLLLLQREQAGHLEPSIDVASPSDLLAELASEYAPLFPQLRLQVVVDEAPALAYFDALLLRLALANALHNACRFAQAQVSLRVTSEGDGVCFEIADDGPGFPDEQLRASLELPGSTSREGTGLGLYLGQRIAALHRLRGAEGRIELLNREGAVFRLHLP